MNPPANGVTSPTSHLDICQDLGHTSYRIQGAITWLVIVISSLGLCLTPHLFLSAARAFAFYLLVRLLINVAGYLAGAIHCHRWPQRPPCPRHADVHHVVVVPNYREPIDILQRTLEGLALQQDAPNCLTVVLAMEERERDARAKAAALRSRFAGRFARFLITIHPHSLPGEVAGKGSNQAWAARQARDVLRREGVSLARVTLTSCDADAVLHPRYFETLSHLFASDPDRHQRFWHAPVFDYNNIWRVPAPVRLMSTPACAARLGEISHPLSWPLPFSTYTLSFQLANQVGYWDPAVIGEDWHMFLRCFYATGGRVSLQPIYLPTTVDAVDGESWAQACSRYYRQQVRHAWGAQDVGYVLQQWSRAPAVPWFKRLCCLLWILHHHTLRSTATIILALGSWASLSSHGAPLITLPHQSWAPILVQLANAWGAISGLALWVVEYLRRPHPARRSRAAALLRELAVWPLLPLFSLAFTALPGLHAHTKLLFGSQLTYALTPKRVIQETCQAEALGKQSRFVC